MNKAIFILAALILTLPSFLSAQVHKNNVAVCSNPEGLNGYSFFWDDQKWKEDKNLTLSITLKYDDSGEIDLFYSIKDLGDYSVKEEGGKVIVFSKTEKSLGLVTIFPNKVSETFIFRQGDLNNNIVMMTQATTAIGFENIQSFEGNCSYLNLDLLTSKQ